MLDLVAKAVQEPQIGLGRSVKRARRLVQALEQVPVPKRTVGVALEPPPLAMLLEVAILDALLPVVSVQQIRPSDHHQHNEGLGWGLAHRAAMHGAGDGVITFSRPITWQELDDLQETGVVVHDIESVTAPDSAGLRWTFAVANEPTSADFVDHASEDIGVDVLGIVSANVTVPDARTLNRLVRSEVVYLVDLSIADFEAANPGIRATQNDVYWILQGWD